MHIFVKQGEKYFAPLLAGCKISFHGPQNPWWRPCSRTRFLQDWTDT